MAEQIQERHWKDGVGVAEAAARPVDLAATAGEGLDSPAGLLVALAATAVTVSTSPAPTP
ncbi:hypothetical protein ASD87_20725 [Achromobacter sp. Root170]|nr:hypothetical protein ASD87_20725 [Achromobacter sp. Root170]